MSRFRLQMIITLVICAGLAAVPDVAAGSNLQTFTGKVSRCDVWR